MTDDLATYKPVVEELGLGHQVCVGRVKKNVLDRLKVLDDEWDRLLNGMGLAQWTWSGRYGLDAGKLSAL